jgi:acetylornithine deacetylase/succinyl-diaminopimelate desuccinylase-like protein
MNRHCSLVLLAVLATAPAVVRAQSGQNLPPESHRQLAREILAQLIAINTTEARGATPAAEALAARFKAAGFPESDIHLVGPLPARQSIVVRFRGDGTGGQPILFIAHLDVVEAKREDWSVDPFTLTERDGWFFGRGTYDIKDEVADLTANFIRLKQEGFTPTRDLILAFTDGEEGGDYNGAEWIVTNRRSLVDAEFVINTDAAGGQMKNGKHLRNPVQTSEKVYATYTLEVTNPGGHSSLPEPDNAIYRLAEGLRRLGRFEFPVQLTQTTREYFRTLAKHEQGQAAADLLAVTRAKPDPSAVTRLGRSSFNHALMRNTCVATMLQAGDEENALPQRARATIQCRLLPGVDPERIRRTLAAVVADTAIAVTLANKPQPSPASPIRPDLMATIQRITTAMWPGTLVLPVMDPWSSDGALFRQAGFPTYGLSAIFADVDSVTSHGKDERVGVQEFYEGVEFMYRLLRSLGTGKGNP